MSLQVARRNSFAGFPQCGNLFYLVNMNFFHKYYPSIVKLDFFIYYTCPLWYYIMTVVICYFDKTVDLLFSNFPILRLVAQHFRAMFVACCLLFVH